MTENENSNVAGQYFCTPCHYMRYTSKESSSHRQNHVIPASHRSRKALDRITYSSSPPWAMNLLAGAERYPYRHFLLYDVTGETLGAAIPLSLGYAFAACLKAGANLLSIFSAFALIRFLAILLIWHIVRKLQRPKEAFAADEAVSTQKLKASAITCGCQEQAV